MDRCVFLDYFLCLLPVSPFDAYFYQGVVCFSFNRQLRWHFLFDVSWNDSRQKCSWKPLGTECLFMIHLRNHNISCITSRSLTFDIFNLFFGHAFSLHRQQRYSGGQIFAVSAANPQIRSWRIFAPGPFQLHCVV